MTIVHMVMFRFQAAVTQAHKDTFVRELKKLKHLPCVKDGRLIVGGPSVTDPIERSKGFEYALVSFHQDRAALDAYQASKEHEWVTSTYLFPFKEDLCRFDFEVAPEDEHLCAFAPLAMLNGKGMNGKAAEGAEGRVKLNGSEESGKGEKPADRFDVALSSVWC